MHSVQMFPDRTDLSYNGMSVSRWQGLSISGSCTGTFIFEVVAPTPALGPPSPALVAWVDGYSIGHDSYKRSAPGLAVGALPGRPKIASSEAVTAGSARGRHI